MSWKILIERGNLEFSAAHFITFAGECEPLHGHNYGVRVEATGPLTEDSYVLDFVVLKDIVRSLIKPWDHRFLLPLQNPHLRLTDLADAWEIEYTGDLSTLPDAPDTPIRYHLPKWSVVPLAVDNVTAERLAELLARRIVHEMRRRDVGQAVEQLVVAIEETSMQAAFHTLDPRDVPPA